jgi:hypothetical protein
MWRGCSLIAMAAVALIEIQTASAAETSNKSAETEEVTVTAEGKGSLTSVSPDESAKQNEQVQGAFTMKTADEMKLGRSSNLEDFEPRFLRKSKSFSYS